jgi:hypothetical protein
MPVCVQQQRRRGRGAINAIENNPCFTSTT